MKYIKKQEEPVDFINWKKRKKPVVKNYKVLNGQINKKDQSAREAKEALKNSLIEEQGHICCYCEQRITKGSDEEHIEHLKPQNKFPKLTLEYDNLLYCCGSTGKNNAKAEPFCGHKKHGWYEENEFISPLEESCETRFKFDIAGRIRPSIKTDDAAQITIKKLGLNARKLIALRVAAIDAFIKLNEPDKSIFVEAELKKKDGKYSPFWTTINQLFNS